MYCTLSLSDVNRPFALQWIKVKVPDWQSYIPAIWGQRSLKGKANTHLVIYNRNSRFREPNLSNITTRSCSFLIRLLKSRFSEATVRTGRDNILKWNSSEKYGRELCYTLELIQNCMLKTIKQIAFIFIIRFFQEKRKCA